LAYLLVELIEVIQRCLVLRVGKERRFFFATCSETPASEKSSLLAPLSPVSRDRTVLSSRLSHTAFHFELHEAGEFNGVFKRNLFDDWIEKSIDEEPFRVGLFDAA
jgi:hypothetical protein